MNNMELIYKDIPGYEGLYQVSNFGTVMSFKQYKEGKILKANKNSGGYLSVGLNKDGKKKTFNIHQLVAISFLNHKPDGTQKIVVDHIDNNYLNNRLDNLQLISQRENSSKDKKNCSSKFTGVHWNKKENKWQVRILIDGKRKHLGYFEDEQEAALAYKKARFKLMEEADKFYEDNYKNKNKIEQLLIIFSSTLLNKSQGIIRLDFFNII